MILSFTLSMPNNNSWNGKWSGEGRSYVIIHNFGHTKNGELKAREILDKKSFYYNFGDGWGASIGVKEVDSKEAKRLNRISNGFCGYEWMVDEIMSLGRIKKLEERT
jgi:hypothetical protein